MNAESVAIGNDGLGLISYTPRTNGDNHALKVAHCSNIGCTAATLSTLAADVGRFTSTSIAIGADGLGLISYADDATESVKVAHCSNAACTTATMSSLQSGIRSYRTSTAIGADGLGLVVYDTTDEVRIAHCENVGCTSATISSVGSGYSGAVTIGADGRGLVAYTDELGDGERLRAAHCGDIACTVSASSTVDSDEDNVAIGSSITTGADGLGLISYVIGDQTYQLRVAHCDDPACTTATTSPVEVSGRFAEITSITVGSDGLGLIGYGEWSRGLGVAHCRNIACTASSSIDVFNSDSGGDTSIAIGIDGMPLIVSNHVNDLGVAHCSNVFCVPYFRRR